MKAVFPAVIFAWAGLAFSPISEAKDMKIRIILNQTVHQATLADNPSARDLYRRLPLILPLEDYAHSEKIARSDFKLSTAQAPARYQGKPGDITYYAPWGNLAFFYRGGPDAAGLIYLGKFDGDFQALLKGDNITIEAAE